MNLDEIVHEVVTKHPEFTMVEVYDLCQEYLSQFNSKTKESTKKKSLTKFVNKEFSLDIDTEAIDSQKSKRSFSSMPKEYFQSQKYQKSDYVLRCKSIYKQIGRTELFEDANLQVGAGEKIALVGKNGAGKSTLLKMIISQDQPNS
jgi:ATPase subunit of ABC transporter with duplicated ATPase domains